jgi:toxin CcdB
MAFLSLHANPNPANRKAIPYLLDVQADLLESLGTRVVVPLYSEAAAGPRIMDRLTPRVTFQRHRLVAMVPELAGIAKRDLGAPVGELGSTRAALVAALDLLFTGV